MEYFGLISSKIGVATKQVAATVALLNENATIPFIARYRKEKTGSLDEVQIAAIADEYHRFLEIEDRKATILKTITEQGKLTDELRARIEKSWDITELEDIYLPYKPHRKTRADVAREQGYEPLAQAIFSQNLPIAQIIQNSKFKILMKPCKVLGILLQSGLVRMSRREIASVASLPIRLCSLRKW